MGGSNKGLSFEIRDGWQPYCKGFLALQFMADVPISLKFRHLTSRKIVDSML